jgi:hypothetical protein
MDNKNKVPQFADVPKFLRRNLSGIVATESTKFFKDPPLSY